MLNKRVKGLGSVLAVSMAVLAGVLMTSVDSGTAGSKAEGDVVVREYWSRNVPTPWKVLTTGQQQESGWNDIGFDDNAWEDTGLPYYIPGGDPALPPLGQGFYFRKEFTISSADDADIQVDNIDMIEAIDVDFQYDDGAILFLNGEEVYRTIRGNVPAVAAENGEISINQEVAFGGSEFYYVQIPGDVGDNVCQVPCKPVAQPAVAPIPVELLNEGENVFGIMVWTRVTNASDIGTDLEMSLTISNDDGIENVVINEVAATNNDPNPDIEGDGFYDEDGDYKDWIELYNKSDEPVSLQGWTIQDESEVWTFPDVNIPGKGYLVIFASDKDRNPTQGNLHTNFKLSKDGDSLKLVNSQSVVVDEIAREDFPLQIDDVTYGATPGGILRYLETPTPGEANSGASTNLDPILRPFSDLIRNEGEPVDEQPLAFDPDGGDLEYSLSPSIPGLAINPTTGQITGTATTPGPNTSTLTVTDASGKAVSQPFVVFVVPSPVRSAALVLNEYNAVDKDNEYAGIPDPAFAEFVGNGGDWLEFVVTEDQLDVRGWTIELWDSSEDDVLVLEDTLEFADRSELSALSVGTILTISEDWPTDLALDPDSGDRHINLESKPGDDEDLFFVSGEKINSSHKDFNIIIRDNNGDLVSPVVGETGAWDDANGGVSPSEVFTMCVNPSNVVDPISDYSDNSVFSTFGAPNKCDIEGTEFVQDFSRIGMTTANDDNISVMVDSELDIDLTENDTFSGAVDSVVLSGDLPDGLTLGSDGILSGTTGTVGEFEFTYTLSSDGSSDDATVNIEVTETPTQVVANHDIVWGTAGSPFTFDVTANDIVSGDITVELESGTIPNGLTLGSDGIVSGTSMTAESQSFTYRLVSSNGTSDTATMYLDIIAPPVELDDKIVPGSEWSYLDDGSDQGTAWTGTGFDDSTWSSGVAEFGYGDVQTTVIDYGGNAATKHVTTYFRRSFAATNLDSIDEIMLDLLVDDGAVVYLNGNEIIRQNMPDGPIDYVTLAPNYVAGVNETSFTSYNLSPEHLIDGENVIAVEVHQYHPSSSDVSFNLGLDINSSVVPPTTISCHDQTDDFVDFGTSVRTKYEPGNFVDTLQVNKDPETSVDPETITAILIASDTYSGWLTAWKDDFSVNEDTGDVEFNTTYENLTQLDIQAPDASPLLPIKACKR